MSSLLVNTCSIKNKYICNHYSTTKKPMREKKNVLNLWYVKGAIIFSNTILRYKYTFKT